MPAAPQATPPDPEPDDPRLRIPEVLRQPTAVRPGPGAKSRGESRASDSGLMSMARAWALAFDFIFTIIGGGLLGWLFDWWRGTAPTGAIIGFAIGFATAFYRIVRHTQKQERAEAEAKRRAGPR
ncbi:MAG: AtpZ/AtpI family protein [Phycisphaerae bacterium]|nr:AtpZ/AtpI family protein [Phycisphaerae bacterium]